MLVEITVMRVLVVMYRRLVLLVVATLPVVVLTLV